MDTFTANVSAVGGSTTASAIVALLPLITFFVMLLAVKAKAYVSGLTALAVAIIVAIAAFHMPWNFALLSATQGAAFGLFPIVWIVVLALWFYQVTVASGRFQDMRAIFDTVGGGDLRIQTILIAFCFGGLLEALAGFGAPVAITATMIMALGLKPLKTATVVLIANTAPVAFGAVAIPITTAGTLTGLDSAHIGAVVGHQAPFFAALVPFIIVLIIDGVRGLRETWPAALTIGLSFAISQWWSATYFSYELTDVVASLVGLIAAVLLLQVWKPKGLDAVRERLGVEKHEAADRLTLSRTWMAVFPYVLVVAIFGVAKLWTLGIDIPKALAATDVKIPWPGLHGHILNSSGEAIKSTTYNFQWLSSPGTLLLITGIIVAIVYSIFDDKGRYQLPLGRAAMELGSCLYRMRFSALTIVSVLSLAYVMNFSGQTLAIGTAVAGLGAAFAFFSPVLGWLGTAVTGSDTSANALFSNLQKTAAENIGLDPHLMTAANTSGGVVGKMISPQSLAIAASSVGMEGKESQIFRSVIWWSIGLLVVLCTMVFLQSNVLAWMLPTP
ncbi:L-lactate permease [Corynebacterium diphtheriae]|uniref:L-lactate permease n=1 Tax=Corynebacterium diphtheriae TaxID=1717 RepID=UPI0013CCB9A7|nr:L-lactate permease [Corynebacterium diphtheriae]MBG9303389.1 L-lactate permease [Corynebacterium diphtheriae bv. mitis]CAB0531769.1 L-lactate permease [Corynebacterium diphtheriae]CAB0920962.1 L-lactate permease [Corynebacterium diphtheriae]CAB0975065.1 L-lactate permease [Corynebacterium diphtheriae]